MVVKPTVSTTGVPEPTVRSGRGATCSLSLPLPLSLSHPHPHTLSLSGRSATRSSGGGSSVQAGQTDWSSRSSPAMEAHNLLMEGTINRSEPLSRHLSTAPATQHLTSLAFDQHLTSVAFDQSGTLRSAHPWLHGPVLGGGGGMGGGGGGGQFGAGSERVQEGARRSWRHSRIRARTVKMRRRRRRMGRM